MKKSICPDTNIFLHFRNLDEIDLPKLLNCSEVEVLISPMVLQELDQHKYEHPIEGIRQRAYNRVRLIYRWLSEGGEIRDKVTIKRLRKPSSKLLKKHGLSSQNNDDCILACLIDYKRSNRGTAVLLLTNDIGPLLRTQDYGIEAIQLPDALQLEHARDPQQQKILQLQRQLTSIQSKAPDLSLVFVHGTKEGFYSIEAPIIFTQAGLDSELGPIMEDLQARLSTWLTDSPQADELKESLLRVPTLAPMMTISDEEIERYKKGVKEYPEQYSTYFQERVEHQNRASRTLIVDLKLVNLGTAPADKMYIDLTLPEKLYWLLDLPEFPLAPPHPNPPMTKLQKLGSRIKPPVRAPLFTEPSVREHSVTKPYYISESCLTWEIPDLIHNSERQLNRVYAVFRIEDDISNFEIAYSIRESNTPNLIQDKLLIKIQMADGKSEEKPG